MDNGLDSTITYETLTRPKCGDIWMCQLEQKDGSVQGGYRPVFILSNDRNNTHSETLNVIPITSKKKKKLPVHVELNNYEQYGLKTFSTMLVEQVTTVSMESVNKYVGCIDDTITLSNILKAMSIQFPILQMF